MTQIICKSNVIIITEAWIEFEYFHKFSIISLFQLANNFTAQYLPIEFIDFVWEYRIIFNVRIAMSNDTSLKFYSDEIICIWTFRNGINLTHGLQS